jgi:hypothetical protein
MEKLGIDIKMVNLKSIHGITQVVQLKEINGWLVSFKRIEGELVNDSDAHLTRQVLNVSHRLRLLIFAFNSFFLSRVDVMNESGQHGK